MDNPQKENPACAGCLSTKMTSLRMVLSLYPIPHEPAMKKRVVWKTSFAVPTTACIVSAWRKTQRPSASGNSDGRGRPKKIGANTCAGSYKSDGKKESQSLDERASRRVRRGYTPRGAETTQSLDAHHTESEVPPRAARRRARPTRTRGAPAGRLDGRRRRCGVGYPQDAALDVIQALVYSCDSRVFDIGAG